LTRHGYGATHTAELPFVFGHPWPHCKFTAAEEMLSQRMQTLWRSFASTGDPTPLSSKAWPTYDSTARNTLLLDTTATKAPLRVETNVRRGRCAFWATQPVPGGHEHRTHPHARHAADAVDAAAAA
jgi:para-nitrobenzyl esterase